MSMTSRISGTRRLERRAELRMMDSPGGIPAGDSRMPVILFITRFWRGLQGILGSCAGIGGNFPSLSVANRGVYLVKRNPLGLEA